MSSRNVVSSFLPESGEITQEENLEILRGAVTVLAYAGDKASSMAMHTIRPELAVANYALLFKYYELLKILEKSNLTPSQTILSGSGMRADEVLAFRDSGRVNILSAEPYKAYNSKDASGGFEYLGIQHEVQKSARNIPKEFSGIVLTDDTHQEIAKIFKRRKVDELAIIRLDPDVFLPKKRIDEVESGMDIVSMQTQSTLELLEMLSIVEEGGEAIVTVGAGNSALAYLFRIALIYGLEELCQNSNIPYERTGSPWLELLFRSGLESTVNNPVVRGIISSATIEGIRIKCTKDFKNLPSLLRVKHFQRRFYELMGNALSRASENDLAERLNLI